MQRESPPFKASDDTLVLSVPVLIRSGRHLKYDMAELVESEGSAGELAPYLLADRSHEMMRQLLDDSETQTIKALLAHSPSWFQEHFEWSADELHEFLMSVLRLNQKSWHRELLRRLKAIDMGTLNIEIPQFNEPLLDMKPFYGLENLHDERDTCMDCYGTGSIVSRTDELMRNYRYDPSIGQVVRMDLTRESPRAYQTCGFCHGTGTVSRRAYPIQGS